MVGGIVIEVAEVKDRPAVLFIDCRDRTYAKDTCAIYVENSELSRQIEVGDSLWWQGDLAYWTPVENRSMRHGRCHIDYDIKIPRVGYSGIKYPNREAEPK